RAEDFAASYSDQGRSLPPPGPPASLSLFRARGATGTRSQTGGHRSAMDSEGQQQPFRAEGQPEGSQNKSAKDLLHYPSHNSIGTPNDLISQLDGWPACAPVNASAEALRPLPHDSGSE